MLLLNENDSLEQVFFSQIHRTNCFWRFIIVSNAFFEGAILKCSATRRERTRFVREMFALFMQFQRFSGTFTQKVCRLKTDSSSVYNYPKRKRRPIKWKPNAFTFFKFLNFYPIFLECELKNVDWFFRIPAVKLHFKIFPPNSMILFNSIFSTNFYF
jgi:hypothetical protein